MTQSLNDLASVGSSMKDYYKILGVKEEASEEEIRTRWIELTKHYHPDLRKTEEGDEKIREINEAYEVLKNESTRFHYDFERDLKRSFIKKAHRRQERRVNIRKIVIPSGLLVLFLIAGLFFFRRVEVAPPPKTEPPYKTDKGSEERAALQIPPLAPQRSPSAVERKSEQENEPAREIFPESMATPAPQVVAKSEMPAMKEIPKQAAKEVSREVPKEIPKEIAKEVPKEVWKETPKQVAKEVFKEGPKEVAKEVPKGAPEEIPKPLGKATRQERATIASAPFPPPAEKESKAKETPAPQAVAKSEMPAMKEIPKHVAQEVPKEVPKEIPKEVVKEVPKEVRKETPKQAAKEVSKEVPKEIPKEVPATLPKEVPKEVIRVTLHPGKKLAIGTKEERVGPFAPAPLAKEEEVKKFFSNYIDRYNRKDVSGFLSFFSPKAVQNQTDRLEAIGNLYTEFIDQSEELRYQIEGMKIEIYQHRVDVKAGFRLDQKLKKDGEEKVWKGNIRWILIKEEGRLKISSLDYQNEKSP